MSKKKQSELANKVAPITESVVQKVVNVVAGIALKRLLPDDVAQETADFVADRISDFAGKWISANLKAWKKPVDATEACREALIVAVFTAFLNKVTEKKFNLFVDCTAPEEANAFFGADALDPLKAYNFDEHNVKDNELFNSLMEIVENRMEKAGLGLKQQKEISDHIREEIDMLFWRVIEQHAERYKVYSDYSNSNLKDADTRNYYYKREEARISGLYTQAMKLPPVEALALNDIYVEPGFLMHQNCWDKDERTQLQANEELRVHRRSNEEGYSRYVRSFSMHDEQITPYDGSLHDFLNGWARGEMPIKGCKDHRLLVLLGQPGQGKTSCCKRLMYDVLASKAVDHVYFVRLKNTRIFEKANEPLSYLREYLRVNVFNEKIAIEDDALKGRKVLLVLDGLDEAILNYNAASSEVERLLKRLTEELYEGEKHKPFEYVRIIVTSRTALFNMGSVSFGQAMVLQLMPFDQNLQCQWTDKFKRIVPVTKLSPELIQQIHETKRKDAIEMLEQPVILFLIASADIDLLDVNSRHDLYDRLFNELIQRNLRHPNEIDPTTDKKTHPVMKETREADEKNKLYRRVIAEIALACFLDGRGCTTFESIKFIIGKFNALSLFTSNGASDAVEATLSKILISFYLDSSSTDQGQTIEFYHRTLMEYLAVEAIVDYLSELCEKNKYGNDEHGQEVVLGLLFIFFGCSEFSERMGEDLEHRLLSLSPENRNKIGLKLISAGKYLIEQECMPKYTPSYSKLAEIAKWNDFDPNDFKPNIYQSVPWKEASRKVLLFYLSLLEIVECKYLINDVIDQIKLPSLRWDWYVLIKDSVDGFSSRNIFIRRHAFPHLDVRLIDISGKRICSDIDSFYGMVDPRDIEEIYSRSIYPMNIEEIELHVNKSDEIYFLSKDKFGPIHCSFAGVKLSPAYLSGVFLNHTDLSHSDMSRASLDNASLFGSNLSHSILIRAHLLEVDLSFATLENAKLQESYIISVSLNRAFLKLATLDNARIYKSNFIHASLEEASLKEAELHDIDFSKTILKDADFEDALFVDSLYVNDETKDQEAYDRITNMLMDRPEGERPKKGPASFEAHVKYWQELRGHVPKAYEDYS